MASSSQLFDGPDLAVDVGVVLLEPGKPLHQWQARLVLDVELDPFMMIAEQEHDHR